jgi:hypothetical protein
MIRTFSIGVCLASSLIAPAAAQPYDSEAPRQAGSLLSAQQYQGAAHRVNDSVPIYAHAHYYTVQTNWGPMTAYGYDTLLIRLREIYAIHALDELSKTEVYGKALAKAATAPLRTAQNLVTNPVDTVTGIPRGMFSFVGRIGRSVTGGGEHDDNVVETISGSAAKKREIAFKYGVSPYSSNKVLQQKINEVARAAAFGGLTMSAATFAMPGGVGMIFTTGRVSENMVALLRDRTPAELREINRKALGALGVPSDDIERFLDNDAYTPSTQTYLAQSLGGLRGAAQPEAFLRLAAMAEDEDDAFLYQRIAQMMTGYSRSVARITELGVVNGLPITATANRDLILFWPADELIWTPRSEQTAEAVGQIVDGLKPNRKELWISGRASEVMRRELAARGWILHENARGRLYDVM